MNPDQIKIAKAVLTSATGKIGDVCKMLNVSRSTVYRHLNMAPVNS